VARTVGIGNQDFGCIREEGYFYVDKTNLIREWWESGDNVTLITRPRRFGKTLNMSMLEKFFSVEYAGRSQLFEGLSIWQEEKYRNLQGTYPVLSLSFAGVKENTFTEARESICRMIEEQYNKYDDLLEGNLLNEKEKAFFREVSAVMSDSTASAALRSLSNYLSRYYKKRVLIFLDEYDTPMQEAYVNGYWREMASFVRSLFHSTFKSNPYLERAVMTGITRTSKESVFSDLNNLEVVATTSVKYAEYFGFTEEEVAAALKEYGLADRKQQVKEWYDGFTFGNRTDIYNPWSIINFLDKKEVGAYWANTSSNSLADKLIREGSKNIKETFELLLQGESICVEIDEQIVYNLLDSDEQAIWSLFLACGYLKVKNYKAHISAFGEWKREYELKLTNYEVRVMFRGMIRKWFGGTAFGYNDFIKALLVDDIKAMNTYMNKVAMNTFSFFDTGKKPSGAEPERFYHGFVLGLMVELADKYIITSNRESGFGRYDVVLEPRESAVPEAMPEEKAWKNDAVIIEFKVQDEEEKELSDTVNNALRQIEEKKYEAGLVAKGIPEGRIRRYGFAFSGKKVLIGSSLYT